MNASSGDVGSAVSKNKSKGNLSVGNASNRYFGDTGVSQPIQEVESYAELPEAEVLTADVKVNEESKVDLVADPYGQKNFINSTAEASE